MVDETQSDRKQNQKNAYNIFLNDYSALIKQQLQYRYKPRLYKKYMKYVNPTKNPLRRCADLQSVMYQREPRIITEDGQLAVDIKNYTNLLYPTLESALKMTHGVGDVFLWPYWDDISKKVYIDIIPPHIVSVEMDRLTIESIRIEIKGDKEQVFYPATWAYNEIGIPERINNKATTQIVEKGEPADPTEASPLGLPEGVFPIIWLSLEPAHSTQKWAIGDVMDLVNGTLEIGELETFHGFTNWLRSFKQPIVDQAEFAAEDFATETSGDVTMKPGPDNPIPYNIKTVDLANAADEFRKAINEQAQELASTRGISEKAYNSNVSDKNGSDAVTEELRQRWRKQVKIFSPYEKQLLRVIIALINKHTANNYDINSHLMVDYFEPQEQDDELKALQTLKLGIEIGTTSRQDYVFKNNPDFETMDDVEKYISKCDASRIAWSELMASRNIPKDPTAPGADPATNGAQGKVLGLVPNKQEYQQQPNDARSVTLNNQGV